MKSETLHHSPESVVERHLPEVSVDHQQLIIGNLSRLALLDVEPEAVYDKPEDDQKVENITDSAETAVVGDYMDKIGSFLAQAHSGQEDEQEVWKAGIELALLRNDPASTRTALIMSRLSGADMPAGRLSSVLAANRECQGLIVMNADVEGYKTVSQDENILLEKAIDEGNGLSIFFEIEKLDTLSQSVAEKLIIAGFSMKTMKYLDHFDITDQEHLASTLIETGNGSAVSMKLENFQDLDQNKLLINLIEADFATASVAVSNLENFQDLDQSAVDALLRLGHVEHVISSLKSFENVDHAAIAHAGVEADQSLSVLEHIDSFDDLEPVIMLLRNSISKDFELASAMLSYLEGAVLGSDLKLSILLECAGYYTIAQQIKLKDLTEFSLSSSDAEKLLTYIDELVPDLSEAVPNDPYAATRGDVDLTTITKPGTAAHANAVMIRKLLRSPESHEPSRLTETLNDSWQSLHDAVVLAHGEEYANTVLGSSQHGKDSMFATYRRLVADYLSLTLMDANESFDTSSTATEMDVLLGDTDLLNGLKEALAFGNTKYLETLSVDVPFYEKIYEEWDAKRMGSQEFEEVFLGRDGVYAYIGRKAQIHARRKIVGMSSDGSGDQLAMPAYLVYPRGFKDNLSRDTKQYYLQQELKNPNAAHYFDTGFDGSIPEDLMQTLGISESEWDKRTRLLSTDNKNRMVLGVDGSNANRQVIIDGIENNVKDEETGEGLFLQESDSKKQRIGHFSEPKTPKERLAFAMTQQSLHRHFYQQELSRSKNDEHEFSLEPVTFEDSGVELRTVSSLSPDQESELESVFDRKDVPRYLLDNATPIWSDDPSRQVFEVPLTGTEGVLVTAIDESAHEGPLDEFETLLLLNRLGVDSPKPLARVFTEGSGYMVEEKTPGITGQELHNKITEAKLDYPASNAINTDVYNKINEFAESFRRDVGLDKAWTEEDFKIIFDSEPITAESRVLSVVPVNFNGTKVFDPSNPSKRI